MGDGSYIRRPYQILFPHRLKIGNNTSINPHSYIFPLERYEGYSYSPTITIGNNVYIGSYLNLGAIDSIRIDDGCVLSEHVYITDNFHGMQPDSGPIMKQSLESKGPVHIGSNCFLGFRVSIMPGVVLGEHCVVGANSVVTRSFPSYSMIAGVPARLIKTFDHENRIWIPLKKT